MERATEQTDRTNGADAEVPRVPSLDAATKLGQSVTSEGERVDPLIDGVRTRPAKTHSFLLLRYGQGCALRRSGGFFHPRGMLNELYFGEHNRAHLVIPPCVWHAVKNVGSTDAVFVNCPTKPYNHEDPDKWALPRESDQIPYSF